MGRFLSFWDLLYEDPTYLLPSILVDLCLGKISTPLGIPKKLPLMGVVSSMTSSLMFEKIVYYKLKSAGRYQAAIPRASESLRSLPPVPKSSPFTKYRLQTSLKTRSSATLRLGTSSPWLRTRSKQTSLPGSFYWAGNLGNPKDLALLETENLCDISNLYVRDKTRPHP
jgi:hypothetical protein